MTSVTSTAPVPSSVPSSASRRARALVGILARTSGAEALAAGLTPYLALMILASVIFGGNGMHPHDVTRLARTSLGFRLSLLGAWLLISMPVARAILASRSAFYLRCLPVPAWTVVPVLAAFMTLVEAHWGWLWIVGEGPAGAGAVAVAIAAHAVLVSRPSRPWELGIAVAVVALIAATSSLPLWNLAGWPLAVSAVWRAWSSAPGRGAAGAWAAVRGGQPRLVALAAAHLATLSRRHRPLLLRWLWLAGCGALVGVFAVRSNRFAGATARTLWLTCLLPGVLFGAAGLIGPLARSAAKASWMLVACGVSAEQRRLALALALLPPALGLAGAAGALSALALSWFSWASVLALVLLGMLAAACAVAVVVTAGLRSIQGRGRDATDLLLKVAVVTGLLMLATWRFRAAGLVGATILLAGLHARLETARRDTLRSARIAQQGD
jgi:hypothetical protein